MRITRTFASSRSCCALIGSSPERCPYKAIYSSPVLILRFYSPLLQQPSVTGVIVIQPFFDLSEPELPAENQLVISDSVWGSTSHFSICLQLNFHFWTVLSIVLTYRLPRIMYMRTYVCMYACMHDLPPSAASSRPLVQNESLDESPAS